MADFSLKLNDDQLQIKDWIHGFAVNLHVECTDLIAAQRKGRPRTDFRVLHRRPDASEQII